MQFKTYTIVYIISNLFSIFIINRFVRVFCKEHLYSKASSIVTYLFYFAMTTLVYLLLDVPIITLCLNWCLIYIILLTYKLTYQKRFIYATYILIFMLFPELIIGAITGYFKFSFFINGNYSDSIGVIITKISTYIEALLLYNYKSTKENQNVSFNLWLSSIIIPILTLFYEIIFISDHNLSQNKIVLSVVILFSINITAFYLYDSLSKNYVQQHKISILETENILYSKQCEIMQTSTKDLQAFRHDMNNQFIALSELFASKSYDAAKLQLDKLVHLTKAKIIYSTSGNIVIDGLINYKLQTAINDNITIKTEIAVPIQLPIDTSDIVIVIGNLIDNALFALENIGLDDKFLNLKIVFSQKRLIIRVSNPYSGDIKYKDGIIVTSKEKPEQHGYGLSNVSKIVDKYKGYMEINHSNNIFIVDIVIYTQ